MKKLCTLLLALWAFGSRAQNVPAAQPELYPKDATTGLITYTEVVPVAGVSQAELFKRSKIWLATYFPALKQVVQAEDKEAGFIVATPSSKVLIKSVVMLPEKLHYVLKFNFKEGKYKYELTELYFQTVSGNKIPAERRIFPTAGELAENARLDAQCQTELVRIKQELVASLKAAMAQSTDF